MKEEEEAAKDVDVDAEDAEAMEVIEVIVVIVVEEEAMAPLEAATRRPGEWA